MKPTLAGSADRYSCANRYRPVLARPMRSQPFGRADGPIETSQPSCWAARCRGAMTTPSAGSSDSTTPGGTVALREPCSASVSRRLAPAPSEVETASADTNTDGA